MKKQALFLFMLNVSLLVFPSGCSRAPTRPTQALIPVETSAPLGNVAPPKQETVPPVVQSMSFGNQLFAVRLEQVHFFREWVERVQAHPNSCIQIKEEIGDIESMTKSPPSPDGTWTNSELAFWAALHQNACSVYNQIETKEKLPSKPRSKQPYQPEDMGQAKPWVLKWLSSCQTLRGTAVSHMAAEQLKTWVRLKANPKALREMQRAEVPCLGSKGIYKTDFDTLVLPFLTERLQQLTYQTEDGARIRKKTNKRPR